MCVCVCVFIRLSKGPVTLYIYIYVWVRQRYIYIYIKNHSCKKRMFCRKKRRIWRKHYSQVPKGKFTPEIEFWAISSAMQMSHGR